MRLSAGCLLDAVTLAQCGGRGSGADARCNCVSCRCCMRDPPERLNGARCCCSLLKWGYHALAAGPRRQYRGQGQCESICSRRLGVWGPLPGAALIERRSRNATRGMLGCLAACRGALKVSPRVGCSLYPLVLQERKNFVIGTKGNRAVATDWTDSQLPSAPPACSPHPRGPAP